MDDLTNGMKKISIKLKMPTEEQHNAQLRKIAEAEKAKAKTTRKPPVPRTAKAKSTPTGSIAESTTQRASPKESKVKPEPVEPIGQVTAQMSSSPHAPSYDHSSQSSQASNVRTMSAVEFLASTEAKGSSDSAQDVPSTDGMDLQSNDALPVQGDVVSYPSIDLRMDSASPPKADVTDQVHHEA